MNIETTRFGTVTVADDRVMDFPKGLLGFSKYRHYVLIESGDTTGKGTAQESYFWWLQSVDVPELAFIVTDPSLFVSGYSVPVHADQLASMGIASMDEAQVFVIVNKIDQTLTGNLQGPLVVNVQERRGEQLVLSDRRFTTRVPLMEVPAAIAAPVVAVQAPVESAVAVA
ncbi:MAG: flagellar assembly protein FliW [Algisphaera sp.]